MPALDARGQRPDLPSMPFFDDEDARALQTENLAVDAEIDLTGMARTDALEKLAYDLAEARRARANRVLVRITPATPGGGETLFLPVGRYLRDEVANGRAVRAMPAMNGAGWVVRLNRAPAR
jgi:DNA-nicking Smr family endonuclease